MLSHFVHAPFWADLQEDLQALPMRFVHAPFWVLMIVYGSLFLVLAVLFGGMY